MRPQKYVYPGYEYQLYMWLSKINRWDIYSISNPWKSFHIFCLNGEGQNLWTSRHPIKK